MEVNPQSNKWNQIFHSSKYARTCSLVSRVEYHSFCNHPNKKLVGCYLNLNPSSRYSSSDNTLAHHNQRLIPVDNRNQHEYQTTVEFLSLVILADFFYQNNDFILLLNKNWNVWSEAFFLFTNLHCMVEGESMVASAQQAMLCSILVRDC